MKIVPYRDPDDGQMKKALLPQTQEEGVLLERAIKDLAHSPPQDLSPEDINDLANMLEVVESAVKVNAS